MAEQIQLQNNAQKNWEEQIRAFAFPRWNELPEIDLYMDQVVGYLSQKLSVFFDNEDGDEDSRCITATMINNYVKQKIIPGPKNKRYDRASVSALFRLFCYKQILSIGQSADLIAVNNAGQTPEAAHDRFCAIFEMVLHRTVRIDAAGQKTDDSADTLIREDPIMTAAAIAFSNKIYAKKLIAKAKAALPQAEDKPKPKEEKAKPKV